ncbi:MAG: cytochrome C biogenesis protein ResB [Desulfuromonadaceae bacterium]|nr:cytochrome C biogenesis protein ResB [Desulfuromonadaceae bacterium]MDD2854214.1 cytochrome C biogenesis protein ResB [Desulfuromonadaceae bacterium]
MKKLWNLLISINFCIFLIAVVCIAMATGSFLLKGEYANAINSIPLYLWLANVPLQHSWWLWLAISMIAILAFATLACTFEAIRERHRNQSLASLLAPQLIHIGFLLIAAAHLTSSFGGSKQQIEVIEGSLVQLPNSSYFRVAAISAVFSERGMPIGFSSELLTEPGTSMTRTVISPNQPWFSGDYGVYIKQAVTYPYPRALLEIHREPGAGLALVGAVIFTIGNILVLWFRSKKSEISASK